MEPKRRKTLAEELDELGKAIKDFRQIVAFTIAKQTGLLRLMEWMVKKGKRK